MPAAAAPAPPSAAWSRATAARARPRARVSTLLRWARLSCRCWQGGIVLIGLGARARKPSEQRLRRSGRRTHQRARIREVQKVEDARERQHGAQFPRPRIDRTLGLLEVHYLD